ncbi:DUF2274 domain-containing protein [Sphingomonas sp. ASV193]|uniref:DUF2274 domain-containing protein n=1 Tax=Sphingomonas sp. ASV193 TaxID=3144405 RepID=UPI0032E9147A
MSMPLRLPRLPDRTPVKLVLHVAPALHEALVAYAALYEAQYGRAEAVTDLVPAMLDTFLAGDRSFQNARRRES